MPQGFQLRDFLTPTVALLALLFTVGSFWWGNWRRGRIVVGRPRTYSYATNDERTILLLPLPISNTGARTIIVSALRLVPKVGERRDIPYVRVRTAAVPKSDGTDFASAVTIGGRGAVVKFCEFEADNSFRLTDDLNVFYVEALLDHKRQWIKLGQVSLHVNPADHSRNSGRFITYDNLPSFPR